MIFAFGYFPGVVLELLWGRLTAKAVEITLWLSIPTGIFAVWTWTVYKWFQPHPTIWGVVIGFGLMIILSLLTQKRTEEDAAWKKLKPILWPKQPTIVKTASDYWFIGISSAVITAIGLLIMGLYRGWFFWA